MPPGRPHPRDFLNPLQVAALHGRTEVVEALLAGGAAGIDDRDQLGVTSLMYAAAHGHTRIVELLLDKGGDTSLATEHGFTALHMAAQAGHPAVVHVLLKAGAGLTARTRQGCTALHHSAEAGHAAIVETLIEAGTNPNAATPDGTTPLYRAASTGRYDAVKALLRAKANPLLTATHPSGKTYVPLDTAAQYGHVGVVRELMKGRGIRGCGGSSGGVDALELAAREQHLEIMKLLTDAGVVDTGIALIGAASYGREGSVKLLLRQQQRLGKDEKAYVNTRDRFGFTALMCSIEACRSSSPRLVRILVNAGVDTTSPVRVTDTPGGGVIVSSPVDYVVHLVRNKKIDGRDATEEQLDRLEAVRRLLLRVDAVHAVSWLWPGNVSPAGLAVEDSSTAKTSSKTQPTPMLPIMRRRARRRGVVLPTLFRWVTDGATSRRGRFWCTCLVFWRALQHE